MQRDNQIEKLNKQGQDHQEASEELRLNYERISSELKVENTKIIEQLQKIHILFYQLEAEAKQCKERLNNKNDELDDHQQKHQIVSANLQEAQIQIDGLEEQVITLINQLEEKETRLNNKNYELDDHKKKHQIVSANLEEAQLQIDGLEESVNTLTRDLVALQKINQDLLIEKENLNLQNEKQKKEHLKDLDDQIHAQHEQERLKYNLLQLKNAEAAELRNKSDQHAQKLQEKVSEIAELKEKQQQLTLRLQDKTIQYENLDEKYKQATQSDHEETVKCHQKSRTDTKLKENEVKDLKIQIKELTQQIATLNQKQKNETKVQPIESQENQKENAQERERSSNFLQLYSQENYDLRAKNTTLEAQIVQLETDREDLKSQLQANILIYKQLQIIMTQKFN